MSAIKGMAHAAVIPAFLHSGVQGGWKASGIVKGPGIPAPSGQYRVGCVDLMHQLEGDDRGLLIRLHYPTEATPEEGYKYSLWFPHRKYIQGFLDFKNTRFSQPLSAIISTLIAPQVPALEAAPLFSSVAEANSPESRGVCDSLPKIPPHFPVIVFSHGLSGVRTTYSGFACDLASHGCIVACVEHRDKSACVSFQRVPRPGGKEGEFQDSWIKFYHLGESEKEFHLRHRQVKQRADEVKKSLDILTLLNEGEEIRDMLGGNYDFKQFKGHVDVSTAAVIGHSFGGATTVQTLSEDARFKCGIALDASMVPLHRDLYMNKSSVSQPLYFINTSSFQWKVNVQKMMSMCKPPDANGMTLCRILTLNNTHHYNQSDIPFLVPNYLNFMSSRMDDETAHYLNMDICHSFLRRHLLKDSAYQQFVPNLDGTEGHSEHIIFGTNVDFPDSLKSNL